MRIAVIMAGGSGRRFWPLSREARPKQLVPLIDGKCLLELTIERLLPIFRPENIWIVTQAKQLEATERVASVYGRVRLLSEPVGKNTAPCMAYAATLARAGHGDPAMVFLPADHLISDHTGFRAVIAAGLDFVEREDNLLTLGIKPQRPATGFGYIRCGKEVSDHGPFSFFKVRKFAEKPSLRVARRYLTSGDYLWNAGIFLCRASVVLKEMARHLPELMIEFERFAASVGGPEEDRQKIRCYSAVREVSIDLGVMEKTSRACVVPADIGWDDLGTWDSFSRYMEKDRSGNSIRGNHVGVDSRGCVVYSDKRLVATIGLEDVIIVATDDAILLARRDEAERVKELADLMEEKGFGNLL